MREIAAYDAEVELRSDGSAQAQMLDLPGCVGRGASVEGALRALAAALPGYYAWLRRHDDYTPHVSEQVTVAAREVVSVPPGAFFARDAEPVDAGDLDLSTALLEWTYADLSALLAARDDTWLDVPLAAGEAPRALLETLLRSQLWLIARLDARPAPVRLEALPGGVGERLRMVGQASVARLRSANDDEREHMYEHDGERWSLRKVLRRSVLLAHDTLAAIEGVAGAVGRQ
ncbi:MAG: hypothetical protein ACHQ4H_02345 [Ktedonobacterales bacterium]